MKEAQFTPKLFSVLKGGIKKEQLGRDIAAGIVVGVIALPLAIAFAIASGVSPEKGIITAIIAGFIISALGGSRVQIGGPTGAFIVIVYSIVQEHGVAGLTIATFIAGFLLIGMGLARLGNLLKYIPYPLIVGFTSGIAVIIFSSQIKEFFGLPIQSLPADFIHMWKLYASNFRDVNWFAFAIAAATVLITYNFHRISKSIPGSLVAIVVCSIAVRVFDIPVRTIGTSFGEMSASLSWPVIPQFDFETVKALIQPAFAIALLGGIESLLSAVVADGMIGGRHRSNAELIAQGIANCASALFGGIPATGAIARTATNVKNGGRTPIAGITHALILFLIMLAFARFARLIPMACLAGILLVVAYHMSEWKPFVSLLKENRSDVLVLLVTFVLTVVFDLVIAIEVGIVLSSFTLVKRLSKSVSISTSVMESENGKPETLFEDEITGLPDQVLIYEINGALFFGAARTFQDTVSRLEKNPKVLILRMRHVPFIDATGIHRLKEVLKEFTYRKVSVIISGLNEKAKADLETSGIYEFISPENLVADIYASVERARQIITANRAQAFDQGNSQPDKP